MYPLSLVLVLSLLAAVSEAQYTPLATLTAINATDLYRTLYYICNRTLLCRELYYLEDGASDFRKFAHQLSLIELFGAVNASNQSISELFVTHLWPPDWAPLYLVQYDALGPSFND